MSVSAAKYRQLYPKQPNQDEDDPDSSPQDLSPARRYPLTAIACNGCRVRKSKCDGIKPTCTACANRQQECTYRTPVVPDNSPHKVQELQRVSQSLHDVLELLRSAPPDEAVHLLRQLRDRESVVEFVTGTHESPAPSPSPVIANSWRPAARSALEFDLNNTYPYAFPSLEPIEIGDVDLRVLGIGNLGPCVERPRKRARRTLRERQDQIREPWPLAGTLPGPIEPSQYIDPRLEGINILLWTSVPISNLYAARVVSFYLINEHPVLGIFHPVLFIRDFIRCEGPFCSPLLVSSLLAWACSTYSQFDNEAQSLSREFLEEAKSRWSDKGKLDNITTISAAILLALTCNQHGMDRVGLLYLDASAEIGRRLGIFDSSDGPLSTQHLDGEAQDAASFVAWGAFGWHTLHALHFRRNHQILEVPTLPIPGDKLGPDLGPCMGSTFTWISKFWAMIHQTFRDGYPAYSRTSVSNAEKWYLKLLSWSENLPDSAKRTDSCPHHVLIMHIWYQTALMDIWRPFLDDCHAPKQQNLLFHGNTPIAAYEASVRQLKRLVYIYRKRYETTNRTMLITPGCLYLLNEVFRQSDAPDAQFCFILSARGCLAIAPWCRGLSGICKAFMSLGSRTGIFKQAGWNDGMIEDIRAATMDLVEDGNYRSLYPIDLDPANEGLESGNMEALAGEFSQLALRDELSHKSDRKFRIMDEPKVWKGELRDLDLTLSEATRDE